MKKKKRKRKAANTHSKKANTPSKVSSDSKDKKPSVKGFIVALIACVPLLAIGLTLLHMGLNLDKKPCTAVTQGVVTEINQTHASHGIKYYSVTYTYEVNGHEFTGKFAESDTTYIVSFKGEDVTVCYDPDDPSHSYVKEDADAEKTGDRLLFFTGIMFVSFYILLTWFVLTLYRDVRAGKKI